MPRKPMLFVKFTARDDDPVFKPGAEVRKYCLDQWPMRMSLDDYQALACCKTPAADFLGRGITDEWVLSPFRFLNEFASEYVGETE